MSSALIETLPMRVNDALEHAILSAWSAEADIGLCVVDDTSRVVMLNPAACRILQVDGLLALNMPLKVALAGLGNKPSLLQWLGAPGFDGDKQITLTTPRGICELLLKCKTVRTGTSAHFKVISITDITITINAQRAIEQHHRQWQALNAGVVLADALAPDMPIIYVNPAFEQMSGYSSAESLGRNCRYLQGNDTDQKGLLAIRTAIKNQTSGYAVLRNYRKDGSMYLNELFISPVRDGNGRTTHFAGIQHFRENIGAAAV